MKITITCPRAPVTLEWIKIMQRSGHHVTVIDSLHFPIAKYYKDVKFIKIPSPKLDFDNYKREITKIIEGSDFVIPTCEDVFYLSLAIQGTLLKEKVFIPERDLLLGLHNKFMFKQFMNKFVKVPEMRLIENSNQIRIEDRGTLLKPVFSRFGTNVIREVNKNNIRGIEISREYPWVQQQFIQGAYLCNYAIIQKGKVISHVVYKPKYLVNNAASTYFELTKSEKCNNFIVQFAEDTKYNGQIAFDFIDDGKDLYVLECNPRATSGIHLLTESIYFKNSNFSSDEKRPFESCRVSQTIYVMFGLEYLFDGKLSELIRDYKKAKDVVEDLPFKAQVLSFLEIMYIKIRFNIPFASATTHDIEYNG